MIKFKELFFLFICILTILIGRLSMANEDRDTINMTLKDGVVVIETRPDLAPKHVSQIKQLISEGQYNGVVFHRVIDGFMAQTGDVEFGNSEKSDFNLSRAGTGGSKMSISQLNSLMKIIQEELYLWPERRIQIVQTVNFLSAFKIVLF